MKIKILAVALSVFALFALASCGGENQTDDNKTLGALYSQGLEYETLENNPSQCVITGVGTCTDKDIRIPPSIDGKIVVGIDDGAFENKTFTPKSARGLSPKSTSIQTGNSSTLGGIYTPATKSEGINPEEIESVTLPLTVREIGDEAFLGCTSLDTINTTQNVSAIGKDAFKDTAYYNNEQNWEGQALYIQNCLISVSPSFQGEFTVKEGTTLVADQAFYQCTYVTTVNIAESVTTVGNYAFYGCVSLTYVSNATEITFGNSVFEGCFSYEQFIPGGGSIVTPSNPSEGASGFDEIDESIFESAKKLPIVFTANTTITTPNEPKITIDYVVTDYGFHYTVDCAGEITKELYGITDEGITTIYMRKDDKWYLTTATQPDFSDYQIPSELDFSMLSLYDEKSTIYAYENENGRFEIGVKNNKTAYFGVFVENTQIKTIYSYPSAVVLPDFSNSELVVGTVLDENGNIVHPDNIN